MNRTCLRNTKTRNLPILFVNKKLPRILVLLLNSLHKLIRNLKTDISEPNLSILPHLLPNNLQLGIRELASPPALLNNLVRNPIRNLLHINEKRAIRVLNINGKHQSATPT